MQTKEKALTFEFVDVQKQDGGSDCGLFAIDINFQPQQYGTADNIPITASTKNVVPVYRLIDDRTKMIQCAGCHECYHVACVLVEKKVYRSLDWFCRSCTCKDRLLY